MPQTNLDPIDLRILDALQDDGRMKNVDLADKVGLSASPCLTRVRALEAQGIISKYVALLDPETVGANLSVFVQISLDRQSEVRLGAFEDVVAKLPEVMECYLMSGDFDYLLRVVVADLSALRTFIVENLSSIDGVATIRSGFALKQVVYKTALPVALLHKPTATKNL